ncbi:MAG: type 1 glutamine amidotransferase domain-containing protein [Nibricoccus sp.]
MNENLNGKSVAVLVADGFEQSELEQPYNALQEAGASVDIISPNENSVKAWAGKDFGQTFKVDKPLQKANASDYDALLLPGGVMNPDTLRTLPEAVEFVKSFFRQGKPVAAICHGPQLLIEADVVRGRILTSYNSLKTDLTNAGAIWINQPVVTDHGLVTSRTPADIPEFNRKMIEEFCEGIHPEQKFALRSHDTGVTQGSSARQ